MADLIGCIGKIVKEELESAEKRIWTRIEGIFRDGNQTSVQRNLKLQFKNRISEKILTGEEIKGDDKNPLAVALVDESTGNIVDGGPESSATVEIHLLKGEPNASEGGDWTGEQFNEHIVREAKEPLFAENKFMKLENGTGFLKNIKFRHHAIKIKPSVFRLGVRVVDTFHGVRIKEAKTESFLVKDFRTKYSIKHETPSLSDGVFRLVNISKGGEIEKRLRGHKICTVEDFLVQLKTDSERLKKIVNLGEKKWILLVENALACCPSKERLYASTNMLPQKHKADAEELLESAYKHWKKVKSFDDRRKFLECSNSLGCPIYGSEDAGNPEMIRGSSSTSNFPFSAKNPIGEAGTDAFSQLSPLSTQDFDNHTAYKGLEKVKSFDDRCHFQECLNSLGRPVDGCEDAGTSQMIRGSSSTSNIPFSPMNPIGEAGGEDLSSSSTDVFQQLSPSMGWNLDHFFPGFEEFLNQNDNPDTQLNGLINESNADKFVESRDV